MVLVHVVSEPVQPVQPVGHKEFHSSEERRNFAAEMAAISRRRRGVREELARTPSLQVSPTMLKKWCSWLTCSSTPAMPDHSQPVYHPRRKRTRTGGGETTWAPLVLE